MLILEDLEDMNEIQVIEHLCNAYSGSDGGFNCYEITKSDTEIAREKLKDLSILIAYESVGSWGCDSSSYFLLMNRFTSELFEIHGSHCSCYGFEGQLDLESTSKEVLKAKVLGSGNVFYCGGYDENETENQKKVNEFILSL